MGKVFKIILSVIALLALGLGILAALNWSTIKRLKQVQTLFDADKIVNNFSHMDDLFYTHYLDASPEPVAWPVNLQPLPETVTINGQERNLQSLLKTLDTTSFIVIKDGEIISEDYYLGTDKDDRRISWSVAKSFMSGLYGNALADGQIKSLDDTVETYVPALKGTAYEGASLRNVLNMASGVRFNEDYMDPNSDINKMGRILGLGKSMDEFAATLTDRQYEPRTTWQYVSIDTHVAAMALRNATGKSLHALFNETYSAHLGFEAAPFYMTDGQGVAFALGGLNLTTRDYAKFGQLFLQGGQWNGEQIIPEDWVRASTVHSAPTYSSRAVGYGYQWWIPQPPAGDFLASGIYGQYIYVNPEAGIVIAKNAADREFTQAVDGYGHTMNVNIDMFRSLAAFYSSTDDVAAEE